MNGIRPNQMLVSNFTNSYFEFRHFNLGFVGHQNLEGPIRLKKLTLIMANSFGVVERLLFVGRSLHEKCTKYGDFCDPDPDFLL
jgi:hypothetical protein